MRMFGKKQDLRSNVAPSMGAISAPKISRLDPFYYEVKAHATEKKVSMEEANKTVRRRLLREAIAAAPMDGQVRNAFGHLLDLIP